MSDQELVNEAKELTPAQQAQAATEAVKATNELAQAAGPLLGAVVQVFSSTIAAAPEMFVPALTALVNSPFPLPPPLKTRLRIIIRNAGKTPPTAPPPIKTPQRRRSSSGGGAAVPQQAAGGFPVVPVVAGVAAVGVIGALLLRKKK